MDFPFFDKIEAIFSSFLKGHHFQFFEIIYHPRNFGDAFITVENHDIRLCFNKDRGVEYIEVGSLLEPSRWYDLRMVLFILKGDQEIDWENFRKFPKLEDSLILLEHQFNNEVQRLG
jgi:hypothetical protein